MKTTKLLALIIAAVVILSALMLASCENSTNGKDSDTENGTAEATESADATETETDTETETRENLRHAPARDSLRGVRRHDGRR